MPIPQMPKVTPQKVMFKVKCLEKVTVSISAWKYATQENPERFQREDKYVNMFRFVDNLIPYGYTCKSRTSPTAFN